MIDKILTKLKEFFNLPKKNENNAADNKMVLIKIENRFVCNKEINDEKYFFYRRYLEECKRRLAREAIEHIEVQEETILTPTKKITEVRLKLYIGTKKIKKTNL